MFCIKKHSIKITGLFSLSLFIFLTSCKTDSLTLKAVNSLEITFSSSGMKHYGTLVKPINMKGKHPAVILQAGSAPKDRNWNLKNSPVKYNTGKILSHYLASFGYAVLRYDNMGSGKTPYPKQFVWGQYSKAQSAAKNWLINQTNIDKDKIAYISLGDGCIFSSLSAINDKPKIMVLFSPPDKAMYKIIEENIKKRMKMAGINQNLIDNNIYYVHTEFSAMKNNKRLSNITPGTNVMEQIVKMFHNFLNPIALSYNRKWLFADPVKLFTNIRTRGLIVYPESESKKINQFYNLNKIKKRKLDFLFIKNMNTMLKYRSGENKNRINKELLLKLKEWLKTNLEK